VVQKGTAATLDFAAVTAQSARIFPVIKRIARTGRQLRTCCGTCLELGTQPSNIVYNQNMMNQQFEPKITTGGYGDWKFSDEWSGRL
jgi:endoglucanase